MVSTMSAIYVRYFSVSISLCGGEGPSRAWRMHREKMRECKKSLHSLDEVCLYRVCLFTHECIYLLHACIAKMVRLLTCWREYTNSCIVRRIAYDRAIVHSNRHLLRNCLTAWLKYHQLALRKMVNPSKFHPAMCDEFLSCSCFRGNAHVLKGVVWC